MKVFLAFLVAIGAAVGLGAAFVPAQAATVGGQSISQSTLNSDLSTIANNTEFACVLSFEGLNSFPGPSVANQTTGKGGVYTTAGADFWLGELIQDQLTADLVARDGLKVTAADRTLGRKVLEALVSTSITNSSGECTGSGASVVASLPTALADQQVTKWADKLLLSAHIEGTNLSPSGLAAYYGSHQAAFDKVCFGYIEFRTKATATATVTMINAGTTTFDAQHTMVAATTTKATSQRAGTSCSQRRGTPTSVLDTPVGTVVGPVEISGGAYILAKITSDTAVPYSTASALVPYALLTLSQQSVVKKVAATWTSVGVSVDPRYGTVSASTIVAPLSPSPIDVLRARANTPAFTTRATTPTLGG